MARLISPSEREFQAAVIHYAKLRGWLVHHTRPAMRQSGKWSTPIQGDPGFPDLVFARDRKTVMVELKSEKGRLTMPQKAWGEAIGAVQVWRPSDWDEIRRVLA